MDIRDTMDGAGGAVLLTLPWLLLAIAAWRAMRAGDMAHDLRQPALPRSLPPEALPDAIAARETFAPAPSPAPESDAREELRLMRALEDAECENDAVGLTRDSTALARLLLARGARPEAEALLRKAVMVARRTGLPEAHAEARIELAELARADGDMTSACEHWQMAKLMFYETGRRGDQDRIADMMRRHRCPTDWVLTEF